MEPGRHSRGRTGGGKSIPDTGGGGIGDGSGIRSPSAQGEAQGDAQGGAQAEGSGDEGVAEPPQNHS
jgi:hypothetical protein